MSGKGNCHEFKLVRASGSNDPVDHLKAQNAAMERRQFSRTDGVHWLHHQDHQGGADLEAFIADTQGC